MIFALLAAAIAMPEKDTGIPILFHTRPEGAEVLVVPKNLTSARRPHQCTAPCTLRVYPDDNFEIFAVAPHARGRVLAPLRLVRLTDGRYGAQPDEVTFLMEPNGSPAPTAP